MAVYWAGESEGKGGGFRALLESLWAAIATAPVASSIEGAWAERGAYER